MADLVMVPWISGFRVRFQHRLHGLRPQKVYEERDRPAAHLGRLGDRGHGDHGHRRHRQAVDLLQHSHFLRSCSGERPVSILRHSKKLLIKQ